VSLEELGATRKKALLQSRGLFFLGGVLVLLGLGGFTVEKEVRFIPRGREEGSHTKKRLERVVLESPEFKRFFGVYGEDQVEARKLLTPRVQEASVSLRRGLGKPIRGAVREGYLWLALEGRDRFPKPPLLCPVAQTFEEWKSRYREDLLEVSQVVEALARRKGIFPKGKGPSPLRQAHTDTAFKEGCAGVGWLKRGFSTPSFCQAGSGCRILPLATSGVS